MAKSINRAGNQNPANQGRQDKQLQQSQQDQPQFDTSGQTDQQQEIAALRAQLAAKETELEDARAAAQSAIESGGSSPGGNYERLAVSNSKVKWKFKVWIPTRPDFPVKEFFACDESEAIRVYCCVVTANSKGEYDPNGAPLDTVRYTFKTECLQARERQEAWVAAKTQRAVDKGLIEPGQKLRLPTPLAVAN